MKISVYSEKGGAGKTTFAVAMAYALGWPVLDLDPKKTSSSHLVGRDPASLAQENLIVDFPAGMDLSFAEHLATSELIVMPVRPTAYDFDGIGPNLHFIRAHARPTCRVALFGNAFNSSPKSTDMTYFLKMTAAYGLPLIGRFTHRTAYARAASFKVPYGEMDKVAAAEVADLATAVKGLLGIK